MSTLETLEICFRANLDGVDMQLSRLATQLSGAAANAQAQGVLLGGLFSGGVRSGMSDASGAGRALASGFASGIRSGSGAVQSAVRAMVNSATAKIRSMLSIHSPSKVAQGFGAYFGEGFALGVSGSVLEVEKAAAGLSAAAVGGLNASALPEVGRMSAGLDAAVQSAVERALGGVQLTVPLNVDGMKLGEASIRGINAVTRSAGKVLLNL